MTGASGPGQGAGQGGTGRTRDGQDGRDGSGDAPRRRTVVSGGVPLAVYEQGDPAAPTVVLVHGYPDTHRVWDDVARELAAGFHVVRYDVRGAGASGVPADRAGYRLEALADDLFAVADAVSPDRPVHLAAHDWGSIQSWEAVTDPRAAGRIASFTTMSGPCLDHVGHWIRRRVTRPTPRHVRQLAVQAAHSWYITAFHLPVMAPAVWRFGLARRWGSVLRRIEAVPPRDGHPQATIKDDAIRGIQLYRANMGPRTLRPGRRTTDVPVQLVTLTRDHYVGAALAEGVEQWVPRLTRRTLPATHWSALLEKGPEVARMIKEFADRAGEVGAGETGAGQAGAGDGDAAAHARARTGEKAGRTRRLPFAGRVVVVTGAGSGIGRATALAFAEAGAHVALCDRDLETAERTAELARLLAPGRTARAWRVDVSDGAAVETFAAEVAEQIGVADVVVNNAGIGHSGTFLSTTEQEWRRVLDVNLWGVIHGCRAFGARMAERGRGGHIVNIASAAAYTPAKQLAAYATSKAAVLMLSDCLRAEVAASGIAVTAVCPGIVNTGIVAATTFSGLDADAQAAQRRRISGLYARRNYPPEKVAQQILRAVRAERAVAPVTFEARAARVLSRLAPAAMRAAARLDVT